MKKVRYDILLVAVVLLIAGVLGLAVRPGEEGAWVAVYQSGDEIARYDLYKDTTVTIGEEEYNILSISRGKAAVTEANCGDHTCVRTGGISLAGETIVCLPHKLVIEIRGGEENSFDALSK